MASVDPQIFRWLLVLVLDLNLTISGYHWSRARSDETISHSAESLSLRLLRVALALLTLGLSIFVVFEVETPRWRKVLEWLILGAGTLGLYSAVGHLAILLPVVAGGAGTIVHFA